MQKKILFLVSMYGIMDPEILDKSVNIIIIIAYFNKFIIKNTKKRCDIYI